MNLKRSVCAAVTIFSSALILSASAAVEAPFEVGTWGNFCSGAVTFSFDDNCPNQLSKAQPLFDAKGFHMTLNTATGTMNPNYAGLKTAFAKGHEIASHSVSHPGTMSAESESKDSKAAIEQNVPGAKCVTVAYPNCNKPSESILSKYYIAGRTCSGQIIANNTTSFFDLSSIICGSTGVNTASGMTGKADQAVQSKGWAVFLIHAIDNEPNGSSTYSPIASNDIKGALDYMDTKRSTIWVETFGNIVRYMKERNAASLAVKTTTDNSITVSLTDNLEDATYNFPLSIRRELPTGWTTAVVTQKGKAVEDTIVTVNSKKYVMFQAVPDGGDIVISQTSTAVKEQVRLFSTGKMVLVDNSKLSINSSQFSGANIAVSLFDLKGKVIARYSLNNNESSIALPSERMNKSAFFVRVTDGSKTYIEKFMPQM